MKIGSPDEEKEIARLNQKYNKNLDIESYRKLKEELDRYNRRFYFDEGRLTLDRYLEEKKK